MRGIATLDRKLARDLWRIKGQALAIALVIGAGVSVYVVMLSTLDSLQLTLDTYYQRYRFGDVFASMKRAPLGLMDEILAIPGVEYAEPRVVVDVTIDVPNFDEPATARLISVPVEGRPGLCDLFLTEGDYIRPGHPDEVVVSDDLAEEHGLRPGDSFAAVINGRRRVLRIRGRALSPEYIYSIRPGEIMPDAKRFGTVWMERRALGSAYQMEGGFNDVVLKLSQGASEQDVIDRLDRVIKRYGGIGALPRRLQLSNWYLQSELEQLKGFGTTVPIVFLGVAAFLLNVVLTRIIALQREQIAAIKALGYSNREVGWHYIKLSLGIATAGAIVGTGVGVWMGRAMVEMYADFFHFPILLYEARRETLLLAILIALVAAGAGALLAVRRAIHLPPAEAMRPPPPATYEPSPIEKGIFKRLLTQPSRMIVRSLHRNPVRALISLTGIAFGVALLILGTFSMDAVNELVTFQFNVSQRYDLMVTFVEPASARALYEMQGLPGVISVEGFRSVPVRLRYGHRHRNTSILGLPAEPRLNRIVDASWSIVEVPPDGLALSKILADTLGLSPGDRVVVEVLEGKQPTLEITVSAVVDDYMGMNVYMNVDRLHRIMQESDTLSGAWLQADPEQSDRLYRQLKNTPLVAGVSLKNAAMQSFDETFAELMGTMRTIYTLFAGIIAFGVVYNSARISLSERARELATLRVIGFTKGEASYILLGEMAIVTLAALPVGVALGHVMAIGLIESLDSEVYRIPAVVTARTSMFAALSVFGAAVLSGLIVRRKLDHLDLVEALKIRE